MRGQCSYHRAGWQWQEGKPCRLRGDQSGRASCTHSPGQMWGWPGPAVLHMSGLNSTSLWPGPTSSSPALWCCYSIRPHRTRWQMPTQSQKLFRSGSLTPEGTACSGPSCTSCQDGECTPVCRLGERPATRLMSIPWDFTVVRAVDRHLWNSITISSAFCHWWGRASTGSVPCIPCHHQWRGWQVQSHRKPSVKCSCPDCTCRVEGRTVPSVCTSLPWLAADLFGVLLPLYLAGKNHQQQLRGACHHLYITCYHSENPSNSSGNLSWAWVSITPRWQARSVWVRLILNPNSASAVKTSQDAAN